MTDPYQPKNIPLFKAIYGNHLISLGGTASIENMFSGLKIDGLKALDVGFGLGGVAYYLAEKYQMQVSGVEVYPWMVEYANEHRPPHLQLTFNTYVDGKLPYQPHSFDLVYSKGVLNHVADKDSLFKEIHDVLKPNGLFVIADWIVPDNLFDRSGPIVNETEESYRIVLQEKGFRDIQFRNDSEVFLTYAKELLGKLDQEKELIKKLYGVELFNMIQKQHEELVEKINQKRKFAVRITCLCEP